MAPGPWWLTGLEGVSVTTVLDIPAIFPYLSLNNQAPGPEIH